MNLLNKLKARKNDMSTLSTLIETSLTHSANSGESIAGAHHLVASAFEMDDNSATRALATLDKSPADFAAALASLDDETLAGLGIEVPDMPSTPVPKSRIGKTDATFEAALKAVHDIHNENGDYRPLQSAHVLAGVAAVEYGIASRVFAAMGLERSAVIEACRDQLST